MARMSWTDGWHYVDRDFAYYVENGKIMRGDYKGELRAPYKLNPHGGYDNAGGIKANKRNYDKLIWR